MINNTAFIFMGGLVIGGAIGAISSFIFLDKRYQKSLEKFTMEMEEYYGRVDEYDRNRYSKYVEPEDAESESDNGRDSGVLSNEQRANIRERLRRNNEITTNYASLYKNKTDDVSKKEVHHVLPEDQLLEEEIDEELEDDTAADEDPAEETFISHQKDKNRLPRIISAEKLGELNETYSEATLIFYIYDEVVTTDEDEVIEDYERLLGDCLTKYGFVDNDERVIYVQNFELNTVYEVQKIFASYNDSH